MKQHESYIALAALLTMNLQVGAAPVSAAGWIQASPAVSPIARRQHAMAFDPVHGETVVFGGYSTGFLGDTWVWNGATWQQRLASGGPTPRVDARMIWDEARQAIVLFGGSDGAGSKSDTWTWNGTAWTLKNPAHHPAGRDQHDLAYDAIRQEVVLFSGRTVGSTTPQDTWVWDGTDWTEKFPGLEPLGRASHSMAFDQLNGEVVLFGGYDKYDTWTWDGTSWHLQVPSTIPSVDLSNPDYLMEADPVTGKVVLSGSGKTYLWDGTDWQQWIGVTHPSARRDHEFAADAYGRLVLFGGYGNPGGPNLSDTWLWADEQSVSGPRLVFLPIQPTQPVGSPFPVTVRAMDGATPLTALNGWLDLYLNLPGAALSPTRIRLTQGQGSASVKIDRRSEDVQIKAAGLGLSGSSNLFDVGTGLCRLRGEVLAPDTWQTIPGALVTMTPSYGGQQVIITAADGTLDEMVPCKIFDVLTSFDGSVSKPLRLHPEDRSFHRLFLSVGCNRQGLEPILLVPGYLGSSVEAGLFELIPTLPPSGHPDSYKSARWPLWSPVDGEQQGLHQYFHPDWVGLVSELGRINPNYRVGCAVIPVPWDWRKGVEVAAQEFLRPAIEDARLASDGERVWVVTHSTGALVARSYLQAETATTSAIDKLALIAPANQGAAKAYFGAQGGAPEAMDAEGGIFNEVLDIWTRSAIQLYEVDNVQRICRPARVDALLRRADCGFSEFTQAGLLDEQRRFHVAMRTFLSSRVRSAAQLVPPATLPILLRAENPGVRVAPSCSSNNYLASLNALDASPALSRLAPDGPQPVSKVRTKIFAGCGHQTLSALRVTAASESCPSGLLYPDGAPIGYPTAACPTGLLEGDAQLGTCVTLTDASCDLAPWDEESTLTGDGTLLLGATDIPGRLDLTAQRVLGHTSHTRAVQEFKTEVARFLCSDCVLGAHLAEEPSGAAIRAVAATSLHVAIEGRAELSLEDPLGRQVGIDPVTGEPVLEIPGATASSTATFSSVTLGDPVLGEYTLFLHGAALEEIKVALTYSATGQPDFAAGGFVFKSTTVQAVSVLLDALTDPPVTAVSLFAQPASVSISATEGPSPSVQLDWSAPLAGIPAGGYRVYRRSENEPHLSFLAATTEPQLLTGDSWTAVGEAARVYAIAAVDTEGNGSLLSGFVKSNDRDGDGLTEEQEAAFGSSSVDADSDDDGLSDLGEASEGTSPVSPDSDGDGYLDGEEVAAGSDPLDAASGWLFRDAFESETLERWSATSG